MSGLVIGLVLALGVPALALTLTGSVDEFKGLFGQDQSLEQDLGGNLEATGGIQDASAPVVTASNWDFYDVDVTNRLSVDGASTLTGTSTIVKSYDGFIAYKNLTIATGTTQTVYANTNSGVDIMCDGAGLSVDAVATTLVPTLNFVMGTSTSAAYSANLVASTTLATTTTSIIFSGTTKPFKLASGEYITARLGDRDYASASSTFYSNLVMRVSIPCTLLGL